MLRTQRVDSAELDQYILDMLLSPDSLPPGVNASDVLMSWSVISQKELAEMCGIDLRRLKRALKRLNDAGRLSTLPIEDGKPCFGVWYSFRDNYPQLSAKRRQMHELRHISPISDTYCKKGQRPRILKIRVPGGS